MSQEQLADASGMHRTYIDHVERGEVNPTLVTILAIAEGLDLDPETFVVGLRLRRRGWPRQWAPGAWCLSGVGRGRYGDWLTAEPRCTVRHGRR